MSTRFELDVENRAGSGTAHSRRLRREGKVPAVLYGGGQPPAAIVLDHDRVLQQMEREAFLTSILTLNSGKETQAVVVKDVQRHPAKRRVLHLDFQRILEDEEITLNVPIHYTGQEVTVGVKEQGGEIAILLTEVEVSCLPRNLPEYLELDVSAMELNERLHLSDLSVPEGVALVPLAHDQDPVLVAVNPPRQEEEDEVPELEAAEAAEEGEAPPAAGGEAPDGAGDDTEKAGD